MTRRSASIPPGVRRRILGTGLAGVVAAVAALPLAHAVADAPTPSTPSTSSGSTDPVDTTSSGATSPTATTPTAPASASVSTSTSAPAPGGPKSTGTAPAPAPLPAKAKSAKRNGASSTPQDVTPNYGVQKYRVGVQVKSGAYVPAGTTTAGTELTVTDTPLVGDPTTFTCTTDATTAVDGSTATYCLAPVTESAAAFVSREKGIHPDLTTGPTPSDAPNDEMFLAEPGDTITITQTNAEPNLVADPSTATLEPCLAADVPTPGPVCFDFTDGEPTATDEVFDDAGLPPTAANDTATVVQPNSVDVNVLSNDNSNGAPVTLTLTSKPTHGTAKIDASAGVAVKAAVKAAVTTPPVGPNITYTPAAGFLGVDTFKYQIATANGTASATVTIHVIAPPPTAVNDTATTHTGIPVTVDVTANDKANGGVITVRAVGKPGHGSASISGDKVVYTSVKGFVGTDHFTYTIATAYGTAQATVTVNVLAAPGNLASTGIPSEQLVSLGGALLLSGGLVTLGGRRRRNSAS